MKSILLFVSATLFALPFSGCVAVVEPPHPVAGYSVHYYHHRPYYYSGHTRYWGYPPGYVRPVHRSHVVVY